MHPAGLQQRCVTSTKMPFSCKSIHRAGKSMLNPCHGHWWLFRHLPQLRIQNLLLPHGKARSGVLPAPLAETGCAPSPASKAILYPWPCPASQTLCILYTDAEMESDDAGSGTRKTPLQTHCRRMSDALQTHCRRISDALQTLFRRDSDAIQTQFRRDSDAIQT